MEQRDYITENKNSNNPKDNRLIETQSGSDEQMERLKFEDMDLLYENFPTDIHKHSLGKYFRSLNSFLKFVSDDIHYFNNLINNLLFHLENNDNPEQKNILLNEVANGNKSIKNYIDMILNFFENRNDLQFEIVSLNQTMEESLVKLAEYTDSRKINIFRKFDADIKVKINKEQFYQALLQIIKSWSQNICEDGNIYITTKKNINNIEIEFYDNISGIPDEILKNIFEPSSPLDYEWEFGLVLADKIINDHNGKISVKSSDKLNTFTITLPAFNENEFSTLISERIL